jgi:YD repeat-containing protein
MTTTYPVANDKPDLVTQAAYDPGLGVVAQTVAMNGAVTEYEYDPFGRIITATIQAAGANTAYDYDYDDTGLTLTVTRADGENGLSTRQRYNGLGQLLWAEMDGQTGQPIRVDYEHSQGRLSRVSVPYTASTSLLWTTYRYDALDRTTAVIHPDDTALLTEYSGWSQQRIIDENTHLTAYERDALGRVTRVEEYTGTLGSETLYATTSYTYSAQGYLTDVRLTDVRDQAGHHTHMDYDSVGRLTELEDPDQGHWKYYYETDGPLYKQESMDNRLDPWFEYDIQNRLTLIYKEIELGGEALATFEYDTGHNAEDDPKVKILFKKT